MFLGTQTKLEKMRESKSVKEEYEKLKTVELPELRSQIEALDKDTLPKLKKELKSVEETRTFLQTRKSYAEQNHTDVIVIDKLATECRDIEHRMEAYVRAHPVLADDDDVTKLTEEKRQMDAQFDKLAASISERRDRIGQCYKRADRVHALKEKLNEMRTRRTELESRSQKKSALVDKRDELRQEISQVEAECEKLGEKLKVTVRDLAALQKQREALVSEQREIIDQRRRLSDELLQLSERIGELNRAIDAFKNSDLPRLEKLRKELKNFDVEEKQVSLF